MNPATNAPPNAPPTLFSPYQKFLVALLAFLQFAVILDFMIMSPLGALIMPALHITPRQFGLVVSAYAFSAGASGLLTAGFADRFDRKKLLLFFYTGFLVGTFWCGLAQSFESLLVARIVTGLFGGVIGSVVLAIATDLFALQMRGRVMGVIQSAFAASQILGLPMGLYLSNRWNWHAPFLVMVGFGLVGGVVVMWRMQPVTGHLGSEQKDNPFTHLVGTLTEPRHLTAFATTALLTTGGFMLMPFGSAFLVNNIGISLNQLPVVYLVTGMFTIFIGPLVGKVADARGKLPVFTFGTLLSIVMVQIYTHLGRVSLPVVIVVNVVMFAGIFSRMIPFQALMSAVPPQRQRGAFNAINASIQQLSGGLASVIAGHIVSFGADGRLQHFPWVGDVVLATALMALALVWQVQKSVRARQVAVAA